MNNFSDAEAEIDSTGGQLTFGPVQGQIPTVTSQGNQNNSNILCGSKQTQKTVNKIIFVSSFLAFIISMIVYTSLSTSHFVVENKCTLSEHEWLELNCVDSSGISYNCSIWRQTFTNGLGGFKTIHNIILKPMVKCYYDAAIPEVLYLNLDENITQAYTVEMSLYRSIAISGIICIAEYSIFVIFACIVFIYKS